jgi:glucose-6-phosphate-specific signal transduction histidine kinase
MGRLIVVILIVGAVAYAWQAGWIAQLFNSALDSSMDAVRGTQRKATTVRPADPPPEQKQ